MLVSLLVLRLQLVLQELPRLQLELLVPPRRQPVQLELLLLELPQELLVLQQVLLQELQRLLVSSIASNR